MLVESDMLTILIQSDINVTAQKILKMGYEIPPENEDRYPEAQNEWLQGWLQHYTS